MSDVMRMMKVLSAGQRFARKCPESLPEKLGRIRRRCITPIEERSGRRDVRDRIIPVQDGTAPAVTLSKCSVSRSFQRVASELKVSGE